MTAMMPPPKFDHLLRLTDRRGTFEQARSANPLTEIGYRTDDVARVLVVATREPGPDRTLNGLAAVSLRFLGDAQAPSGACHTRMDSAGRWVGEPSVDDSWGRCVWGLGTAVLQSNVAWARQTAVIQFERAAQQRSRRPRAMAYAALGAAELLAYDPGHSAAHKLVTDYAASIAAPAGDAVWQWPEPRLTDANAILAEATIAAGVALNDAALRQRGLDRLAWLIDYETAGGHLSPTPIAGRGPEDAVPGFDQRPLQVSALADACARAAVVDDDPMWCEGVRAAVAWFLGANDAGEPMWDPDTGGGYDGLHANGVNRNQRADSALAVISTLQQARRLSTVLR
jgi:hypothetical protein